MVSPAEVAAVSEADLSGFSYTEHAENVALALAVCSALGIDRAAALRGMRLAAPDPGALAEWHWQAGDKQIWLVNGFAANDPQSSQEIWNLALRRFPQAERRIALFNCRGRSARALVAAGTGVRRLATGRPLSAGRRRRSPFCAGRRRGRFGHAPRRPARTTEAPQKSSTRWSGWPAGTTLVVGLGNIGGLGLELVAAFRPPRRARRKRAVEHAFASLGQADSKATHGTADRLDRLGPGRRPVVLRTVRAGRRRIGRAGLHRSEPVASARRGADDRRRHRQRRLAPWRWANARFSTASGGPWSRFSSATFSA